MFKTQNLYQNDKKWKDTKLGNSSETIGEWGDLLTSVTMMLNGIGYNEMPETVNEKIKTVNEKIKKDGGFLSALLIPSILPYVWPNCAYGGMTRCEKPSSAPIEKIDAAVAAGKPIILQVDSSEQTGIQTHFVLVKEKRGDDYVLYDPDKVDGDSPDKEVLLTTRYKYNGAKLESEISAVLWFDFYSAELPKHSKVAKIPVPANKYTLYVAEDDLILRAKQSVDSFPWKRMVRWTELTGLEPKAAAIAKVGKEGQWISVQDPDGDQGYVSASFATLTLPALVPPPREGLPALKKWCLKNVAVENPQFETWYFDDKDKTIIPSHKLVKSFDILPKNTVVSVLKPDKIIPGWSGIMYQETYYDSRLKNWVTTRVIGRVKDTDLDDYREHEKEEFRESVVVIDHATKNSTDAQQYMTIIDEGNDEFKARYNMCGELSVAFIVNKKIDTVLAEWKEKSPGIYNSMVGKADKPLERQHMKSLFDVQETINYTPYKDELPFIPLAAPDGDGRRAHDEMPEKLKDHYLITNLRINTKTGDLEATDKEKGKERNHWVVVDRITRNGSRVELYNPFPNKREEYTFGEFYKSVGGDPNAAWWIKREANPTFASRKERDSPEEAFQDPKFEVAIDNRTDIKEDAEQYLYIRGEGNKIKNNLCGEFCVTFILGQSMDTALAHWQEGLKKEGKQPRIWELATLLQAYGFNRRKYIELAKDDKHTPRVSYGAPKNEQGTPTDPEKYIKSFSIDTVLEYWKGVQLDRYNSIQGGNRDEPTGPDDLITILKAYGYDKSKADGYDKDDYSSYRPGSQESFGHSPSRDAEALKTHFVIAGVNINGTTGRLQKAGVAHWVVVTKITPQGNLVGGNGGWVELYNPFPNCWEEYSYREFMTSFRGSSEGSTLWVKKDVSPVFKWQTPVPAKSKENDNLEKNVKGKGNKNSKSNQKAEKDRKRDEEKDKRKKGARLEDDYDKPVLDIPKLVRERLEVASIPREIGRWIRNRSNGDSFFAEVLAETLRESGLLAIHEKVDKNKKTRTAVLADLASSDTLKTAKIMSMNNLPSSQEDPVFRVASAVLPLFTARAIDEIKTVQKDMPVQAYKRRHEFMAWTHGLASNVSDPLEAEIKKRVESLFISQKDQSKVFEAGSTLVPRFTEWASKELEKIYDEVSEKIEKIHSDPQIRQTIKKVRPPDAPEKISWHEFEEWTRGIISTPRPNVYRVRRWGDPVMKTFDFDINSPKSPDKDFSSNFQAVGLYNKAEGFGAVSNYLIIPPADVLWLESLQVEDEYEAKVPDWLRQKMNWLCQERGSIYMFASKEQGRSPWRRSDGIRWGTLALGGNLVQVEKFEDFDPEVKTPSGKNVRTMARLVGLKRKDISRPLDELLALGLVHRCYSVNKGDNGFGDSPKGIVYSPFWSLEPGEWEFMPKSKKNPDPTALYIPVEYLENYPE